MSAAAHIVVEELTMAYGDFLIQRDLSFDVQRGDVFIIMGGSGCGKSTLLRHMIGLMRPARGRVLYGQVSLWDVEEPERITLMRGMGVLYQYGALWSSMTLGENVALPLELHSPLDPPTIAEVVRMKLALVGLSGFEDYYPSQISGGMRKRAALARAMALDPQILFFDEPSAGLDPASSRQLDELILELRDSLGATVVVVTHELPSIFAIGTNSVFLDAESRTMVAAGPPRHLLEHCEDPRVQQFLRRGESRPHRPARAPVRSERGKENSL